LFDTLDKARPLPNQERASLFCKVLILRNLTRGLTPAWVAYRRCRKRRRPLRRVPTLCRGRYPASSFVPGMSIWSRADERRDLTPHPAVCSLERLDELLAIHFCESAVSFQILRSWGSNDDVSAEELWLGEPGWTQQVENAIFVKGALLMVTNIGSVEMRTRSDRHIDTESIYLSHRKIASGWKPCITARRALWRDECNWWTWRSCRTLTVFREGPLRLAWVRCGIGATSGTQVA